MLHLIATHGRSQEFAIPDTSEREWQEALRYGLRRVEAPYADSIPITFTYWGGLWRPDEPEERSGAPTEPCAPTDFQQALATEMLDASGAQVAVTREAERLGWDSLTALVGFLDARVPGGGQFMRWFLADVDRYFSDDTLRDRAMARLEEQIREIGEDGLLLAHSMGSVIAYDLLRRRPDLPVYGFVTFGSPLGFASVRERLAGSDGATPFPDGLARWTNVYNVQDFVSAVRRLAPFYLSAGTCRSVEDAEAVGQGPRLTDPFRAHDDRTYLSSITMGQVLRPIIEEWDAARSEGGGVARGRTTAASGPAGHTQLTLPHLPHSRQTTYDGHSHHAHGSRESDVVPREGTRWRAPFWGTLPATHWSDPASHVVRRCWRRRR